MSENHQEESCLLCNPIDKCRFCEMPGLVLSMANADYSCEYCGEWQEAILGSVWEIVGYEKEEASV